MELLVADDELVIRNLCERGVHGKEMRVMTASSGKEALELLSSRPFDIVLADIHMDPPGGLELTKTIVGSYPHTDVIIMTGYPSLDTAISALKLGAYDYIIKPLDLVLLKATLRRCIERRRLRAQLAQGAKSAEGISATLGNLAHQMGELRQDTPGEVFSLQQDACRDLAERVHRQLEGLKAALVGQSGAQPSSERKPVPAEMLEKTEGGAELRWTD